MKLYQLDELIKTVCPIDGINSNGVIWFKPEATDEQKVAAQAIADAWDINSPPTPEQIAEQYVDAVQRHMDAKARERRYDNIVSACSYAAAPNAFQAESQAYLAWRAACWQHLYQMQTDVMAGERQLPDIADLIAELPALALP